MHSGKMYIRHLFRYGQLGMTETGHSGGSVVVPFTTVTKSLSPAYIIEFSINFQVTITFLAI